MARQWNAQVLAKLRSDEPTRYIDARTILEVDLQTAVGADLGWAKLHASVILDFESGANTANALAIADEAYQLLTGPDDMVVAVVHGMGLAHTVGNARRMRIWEERASALLKNPDPIVEEWRGKIRYAKALNRKIWAEQAASAGRANEARAFYAECMDLCLKCLGWWATHNGPYPQCKQYDIWDATCLLAEIYWISGQRSRALDIIRPYQDAMDSSAQSATYVYWTARVAWLDGRLHDALKKYQEAFRLVESLWKRDHYLRNRIVLEMARVYLAMNMRSELEELLPAIMREAAANCNTGLVQSLWSVLHASSVGSGVDESIQEGSGDPSSGRRNLSRG